MRCMLVFLAILLCFSGHAAAEDVPVSDATQECLDCHAMVHPGIVESWKRSNHSRTSVAAAMKKTGLSQRITSRDIPEAMQNVAVGCAECHLQRPAKHKDTFEHNGHEVHVVVSPDDCATCHATERNQYDRNVMAHAWGNLRKNPLYMTKVAAINGNLAYVNGTTPLLPASLDTDAESCFYCHGTKLEVTGMKTRDTDLGEMDFPVIKGWPNNGVGRINLDGSMGSCASCHTRHEFSIATARKPYTCKECHNGPDVPSFKVYAASKHGVIYSSRGDKWNFTNVPWTVGKDFEAPTCAVCHISLIVDPDENVVAKRSHAMSDRLPVRIFSLIYATPQPINPDTSVIRNADGIAMPATLDGKFAEKWLIDATEQNKRKASMQAACRKCHSTQWVDGHWARFENTIKETNEMTRVATLLMKDVWKNGWADPANIFDEHPEKLWDDIWLFFANNVRFSSAMAGGGDYGVFADGRYHMIQRIEELRTWIAQQKRLEKLEAKEK